MAAAPLEHADQARLALRTIVTEHGPEMLSRPRVLSNLLADLLPDAPRIARILVAAAEDHIAEELREHISAGMDPVTATRIAATVFADATLFPPDACAWVVGEFALALGLVSDNSAPPIRFSPSVTAVMAGDPVKPTAVDPGQPMAAGGPGQPVGADPGQSVGAGGGQPVAADGGQSVAAGPDKSTEPASTKPPDLGGAPGPGGSPRRPGKGDAGRPAQPGRGRQHAGGADPGGRIKAPFPAAAGLAPAPAGAGAVSPGVASPGVASPGVASPGVASPGVASPGVASPDPVGVGPGAPSLAQAPHPAGPARHPGQDNPAKRPGSAEPAKQAGPVDPAKQPGPADPAERPGPAVPAKGPSPIDPAQTKAIWTAVASADRSYFDGVIANGHVDAASIKFPSHYPERRFELKGAEMRIGRRSVSRRLEPEIDLAGPPTDPGISHLHAVLIAQDDGTWSVLDRDSSNGTLVNGREIESGQLVRLNDGDRICLGAWTALTLHCNLPQ